jgi:hypothetical protein
VDDVKDLTLEILKAIQRDVASLKTDVSELKTDVSGLKTDVTSVKSELGELREYVEAGFEAVIQQNDQAHGRPFTPRRPRR